MEQCEVYILFQSSYVTFFFDMSENKIIPMNTKDVPNQWTEVNTLSNIQTESRIEINFLRHKIAEKWKELIRFLLVDQK